MINQTQLDDLLVLWYRLALRQQDYGVYDILLPAMGPVQKQMRALASSAAPPTVQVMPQYVDGEQIVYTIGPNTIVAHPMQMPAGPYTQSSVLSATAAEFGSPPAPRFASISVVAGDMTGAHNSSPENTVDFWPNPGVLLYYNERLADGFPVTQSRFSASYPR